MGSRDDYYLRDLASLLRELSLAAKADRDASLHQPDHDVNLGRLMAYHEVLSLVRDQAQAFEIDLEPLGLADFHPDKELL